MALPCFFVMITMIIGLLAAFPAVSCAATSGNCGENGDVSAAEPVYVGFYDYRGRLKDIRIFTEETVDADEIELTPSIAKIKIMWWKAGSLIPNCENAVIELE